MDVNEWINNECTKGALPWQNITGLLVHIYQNERITMEITTEVANVERPMRHKNYQKGLFGLLFHYSPI